MCDFVKRIIVKVHIENYSISVDFKKEEKKKRKKQNECLRIVWRYFKIFENMISVGFESIHVQYIYYIF